MRFVLITYWCVNMHNIEMGINGNHVYVTIIKYININMIIKQVTVG